MESEPLTIVTMRLADIAEELRIPGAVDGRCSSCSEPISLGPASIAQLEGTPGSNAICTVCCFGQLAREDPEREVTIRAAAVPDEEETLTAKQLADWIDENELNR